MWIDLTLAHLYRSPPTCTCIILSLKHNYHVLPLDILLHVAVIIIYNIEFYYNPASRSPPMFTSQHPNVYIFEIDENGHKQNLTLPCSIDAPSSAVNYTWFREDQELPGSMVNGTGHLTVPNITEGKYASREGMDYYCIARDDIGFNVAIRSRTVTVYYACKLVQ